MKRKVGILGGTFDPPHIGHLIIANEVLNRLQLDEVKFMPNQEPPHKVKTSATTGEDRVRMLELLIDNNTAFSIENIELERIGLSYTFDTMKLLQERNPDHEYYFIIGGDMVEYLPKWHQIDGLVKLIRFVGVNRSNFSVKSSYPLTQVDMPFIDISSTLIRERASSGDTIRYLVPKGVEAYIKEHGLYGSQAGT